MSGDYRLIEYSGSTPSTSLFTLPTAPTGETYSLNTTVDPGFIDLAISPSYTPTVDNWNQIAAGTFSWNTIANWNGSGPGLGTGPIPSQTGDTANFNSGLTGAETVTVDGQQHVGTLTLNPTGAFAYTIAIGAAGNMIYLVNGTSSASLNNLAQNTSFPPPSRWSAAIRTSTSRRAPT